MKKIFLSVTSKYLFWGGLAVVLLAQIPMMILGTDAIVPYHDQLDGELIAYIYQAKYLFSGTDSIPEFLNGASKTALTAPAPLAVLFFRIFSPFTAFMCLQILGQVTAFAGMYLLSRLLTGQKWPALIVGGLYAFLPFLPVYGLGQFGVPMLLYCLLKLWRKQAKWYHAVYPLFYGGMSSLVLCGYSWIILGGILFVILISTGKLRAHWETMAVLGGMSGIYLLTNVSLLLQILGIGEGAVSHKSEYVLASASFKDLLRTYLIDGGSHSTDFHKYILVLAVLVLAAALPGRKKLNSQQKIWCRWLLWDLGILFVLCILAALWNCRMGIVIREKIGTLGAFQFDRILWTAPTFWYVALALCFGIMFTRKGLLKWLGYGAGIVVSGMLGVQVLLSSPVKNCMQELLLPEYDTISYADYLAIGVMDEVEEYIYVNEGLKKPEYRVVSLGIDPAAALYHGFYCLDGYSNNYDVEYKHAFRKVIEPELQRNDWLRTYFDGWGNRCYLVSSEIPGYYNIQKGTAWFNDLQINTSALKDLGCTYILSAAYIVNSEKIGLQLLNEEPLETPDSYYFIYIYKIS